MGGSRIAGGHQSEGQRSDLRIGIQPWENQRHRLVHKHQVAWAGLGPHLNWHRAFLKNIGPVRRQSGWTAPVSPVFCFNQIPSFGWWIPDSSACRRVRLRDRQVTKFASRSRATTALRDGGVPCYTAAGHVALPTLPDSFDSSFFVFVGSRGVPLCQFFHPPGLRFYYLVSAHGDSFDDLIEKREHVRHRSRFLSTQHDYWKTANMRPWAQWQRADTRGSVDVRHDVDPELFVSSRVRGACVLRLPALGAGRRCSLGCPGGVLVIF